MTMNPMGLVFGYNIQNVVDEDMWVITYNQQEWLVGVHIANRLNRETFNIYRTLKIRGANLIKLDTMAINYLIAQNIIRAGTHSVTLVPLDFGIELIKDPGIPGPRARITKHRAAAQILYEFRFSQKNEQNV